MSKIDYLQLPNMEHTGWNDGNWSLDGTTILPCPFCGQEPDLTFNLPVEDDYTTFEIACNNCDGFNEPIVCSDIIAQDVIKKWNGDRGRLEKARAVLAEHKRVVTFAKRKSAASLTIDKIDLVKCVADLADALGGAGDA